MDQGVASAQDGGYRTPLVDIPRMLPATFRSSATRGKVAMALVGVAAAVYGVQLVVTASQMGLLDAAAAGSLSQADANASDGRLRSVASFGTLTYVISAIGVLAWLWRAVGNIPMLTARATRWSRYDAVGWWFAPIANWVMPYRVVRDSFLDVGHGASATIVTAWWVCHLGSTLVGLAIMATSGSAMTTLDGIRGVVATQSAMLGLEVAAGVLLVLVIRRMEALARVRERATPDLAPVTPAWGLPVDSGQPQEPQAVVPGDWTAEPVEEDQRTIQSVVASAEGPFAPPPPPVDRP